MASLRNITSADAVFRLTIPGVFATPRKVEGFASDDAFMTESIQIGETMIGVDGKMSSAFLPFITPQTVTLQASSPSLLDFDLWVAAQLVSKTIFQAQAIIQLPALSRQYVFTNGTLHDAKLLPDAKRVLQPVQYVIHWESVQPAPL
jgi:hypothetical protein